MTLQANSVQANKNAALFLRIEDVSKYYALKTSLRTKIFSTKQQKLAATHLRALANVSLKLKQGETMALVGESGCGKSTLLKAILRLITIDKGDIFYEGKSIYSFKKARLRDYRRKFQMIFQNPYASLPPRLRVETILKEPLMLEKNGLTRAVIKQRVGEMIERVGLSQNIRTRYPHEFSGGQQQRIAIARALIARPEFVAADEPVSALDVSVQAQILNLLIDLKHEERFTCLFVTHDLAVARYFSDNVAVMYLGQIVEVNSSAGLFKAPQHPYTKLLLSSVAHVGQRVTNIIKPKPSLSGDEGIPQAGCPFMPRCTYATERCKVERPVLRLVGKKLAEHQARVACHEVS